VPGAAFGAVPDGRVRRCRGVTPRSGAAARGFTLALVALIRAPGGAQAAILAAAHGEARVRQRAVHHVRRRVDAMARRMR
jgi:hypothetical protein